MEHRSWLKLEKLVEKIFSQDDDRPSQNWIFEVVAVEVAKLMEGQSIYQVQVAHRPTKSPVSNAPNRYDAGFLTRLSWTQNGSGDVVPLLEETFPCLGVVESGN
jgi:hypothetical protein